MMKKKNRPQRVWALARYAVAATTMLSSIAVLSLAPVPSAAQSAPHQRVVDGRVLNKAEQPINGAIVYLKDSKSNSVKTFICGEDGHFHFGQLSQNTDYEIWAELSGHRSKNKSISSFDAKNSFNFTLSIDM